MHVGGRGTSREAAALLRAITGRDERARTVLATAADTDRAQLPEQVRDLLRHHERTRAPCRANHRHYVAERCSDAGYDLAAEIPALRAEVDFLATAGAQRFDLISGDGEVVRRLADVVVCLPEGVGAGAALWWAWRRRAAPMCSRIPSA